MKSFSPIKTAALMLSALASTSFSAPAVAEPYQAYLDRLRHICEVDCRQPRGLQIAARRAQSEFAHASDREEGETLPEMAVIMDVALVLQFGDKYELHDRDLNVNPLEEQAVLGSAGINTSSRSGIGGLSRSNRTQRDPNLLIIEFGDDVFFDLLDGATQTTVAQSSTGTGTDEGLLVEGDSEAELERPTIANLRSYFRGRRIVVRGTPRLEPVFFGGRRDFRRKQVTLVVESADDIALLPEYDEDGNAIPHDGFGL